MDSGEFYLLEDQMFSFFHLLLFQFLRLNYSFESLEFDIWSFNVIEIMIRFFCWCNMLSIFLVSLRSGFVI